MLNLILDRVGLIDLGTLGKIQITGPDSIKFLERIYTGHFQRLKVGRLRYALACDETGVIIDDGIVVFNTDFTSTDFTISLFYNYMMWFWATIVFHLMHPRLQGPLWARSLKSYLKSAEQSLSARKKNSRKRCPLKGRKWRQSFERRRVSR